MSGRDWHAIVTMTLPTVIIPVPVLLSLIGVGPTCVRDLTVNDVIGDSDETRRADCSDVDRPPSVSLLGLYIVYGKLFGSLVGMALKVVYPS